MPDELHPETVRYVLSVGQEYRKKFGQFFTPRSLREELIEKLPRLSKPKVLDPACGTGEFLLTARDYFEEPELYCWEIDPVLADIARRVVPEASIEVVDSLKKPFVEAFDVVLGNPPYLEVRLDRDVETRYFEVISGRVNLYSLFIYLGLKVLKPGGWLAYVVSSSMNNGAYFKKLREYIIRVADIEYMKTLPSSRMFTEANHTFQLLVLRKRLPNHKPAEKFVFEKSGRVVFSEHAEELKKSWIGSLSLAELDYRVQTGRIVWNQYRDKLTDDPKGSVLLIWSHNVGAGKLVLGNRANKPQYIRGIKVRDRGPAIVTNRVVGHPSNPKLRAAIVPEGLEFVAENHVNVIYPPRGVEMTELSEIVEQLNSERISRYIRMLVGNTQVSARELEHLVPIVPTETMKKRLGERQVV
ncbi:MAG: N-6 DNA methylase [Sulfolobales archaeon]